MTVWMRTGAAAAVLAAAAALPVVSAATAQAQEPVCPEGTYWEAAMHQCVPAEVYVNPNPVVGPAGPVGIGGVVGPVGPGPLGPGR